jgi:ABC-type branched-subunit amino acid transport system permease subunit
MSWQHLPAIAFAAATVLVLAIALNLTHGLAETATMLAVIAVIVGAYALRNYARRRLVYQKPPDVERFD